MHGLDVGALGRKTNAAGPLEEFKPSDITKAALGSTHSKVL